MAFDWSTLLSGGLSVATGGVFGLIGAAISQAADIWKAKQQLDILKEQNRHAVQMKEADARIMEQEWAGRTRVAATEAEGRENVSANEAFSKSFEMEPKRYAEGFTPPKGGKVAKFVQGLGWTMMVFLDAIRGSIRPGYAIFLGWLVLSMYETQRATLALLGIEQTAQMAAVYIQIVNTILFLFTTCVLWYFGVRNKQQPPSLK